MAKHRRSFRRTAIPRMMRAAAIDRFGGPGVLKLHRLPVPAVGAREVLIALHTAGVGSWDADIRGGWWPEGKPRFPLVLGTDGSGLITAAGALARRFRRGERVYSYSWMNPKGGFYAEYVAVAEKKVSRTPHGIDLRHAGAMATTGLTALQGVDKLRIRRGERVIVHGASGGVGTLALQLAKLRGARVLATASGRDGIALVRRLGADVAVDGRRENITAVARRFAPDGIDAVLAFAGGRPLERCLDALRDGGRLAYPNGVEPEPRKRRGIKVVTYDGRSGVREFRDLNRAAERAKLRVPIAAAFPLAQAARAHKRLDQGHVLGKVVLRIRS
jgi:NADPH:quinone reductase-like Zn-dependent oxidoreductase